MSAGSVKKQFPNDDNPDFFSAMKIFSTAIILAIALCSCERETGTVIDSEFTTPFLKSISLTVSQLNLDDTIPSPYVTKISTDLFEISDTLSAAVHDPRGTATIQSVKYYIYPPGSTRALASGNLSHLYDSASMTSTAIYGGVIHFRLSRTEFGTYRIEAVAIDQANVESNHAELSLFIRRSNSRPILGLRTLREYVPPGSDSSRLTLTITASDSDGYADVAGVTVLAHQATDSSIHRLLDDGSIQSGDNLMGDGVFTTVMWIHPLTLFKDVQLELTATDSKGAQSAVVIRSMDNRPPRIDFLNVPDSIRRPPSGNTLVVFQLTTSDPDGLPDIDSVYFRNYTSATPTNFLMYDDGLLVDHGDQTAGDGTYSLIVAVSPSNTLGKKEFHFFVTDKAGATATIVKFITIF